MGFFLHSQFAVKLQVDEKARKELSRIEDRVQVKNEMLPGKYEEIYDIWRQKIFHCQFYRS